MGNIIKLKQKDIENIVKNIVKEANEYDDFDTKKQPEEFPEDEFDMNDPEFQYQDPTTGETYHEDDSKESNAGVVIVVDPNTGKKYVIDSDNEKVLGITN